MQIYLDAVWTLNILLDLMLLLLTKALMNDKTSHRRTVFGAFVASLIVPITIYDPNSFFTTVFGKLIFSILIVRSAFHFVSLKRMAKQLLLFYFLTFSVGGGLTGLHFMMNQPFALSAGGVMTLSSGYGDPVSWLFILVGFPLVWLFTKKRMDQHASEKVRYDQMYLADIKICGKTVSTTGYIDSGNQLVDPLSRHPVLIGDEMLMKNWFLDDEWALLKPACEKMDLALIPDAWKDRIRMIPYQGVEGKSQFLFALRPEQVTIHYGNQKIISDKLLIGIQFGMMTHDQSYHLLLHPQLIKQAIAYSA